MPPGSGLQVRARAPHSPRTYGLPAAARPIGRGSILDVTQSVTTVNATVTRNFVIERCARRRPRASKDERAAEMARILATAWEPSLDTLKRLR
jgi:hypothetical protein